MAQRYLLPPDAEAHPRAAPLQIIAVLHAARDGDAVSVAVHKRTVIVTPVRRVRGGHDLRALVRRIPKGYKPEELDWRSGGRRRGLVDGEYVPRKVVLTFDPQSGHELSVACVSSGPTAYRMTSKD